uniref:uncharacterized protein LOC114591321 n=1 Tax=Podarcis muralis TaxID=64176 RepID=UPI00109FA71E|nr:uncharacterized protein LOC114591321 [Podarcis muralis]
MAAAAAAATAEAALRPGPHRLGSQAPGAEAAPSSRRQDARLGGGRWAGGAPLARPRSECRRRGAAGAPLHLPGAPGPRAAGGSSTGPTYLGGNGHGEPGSWRRARPRPCGGAELGAPQDGIRRGFARPACAWDPAARSALSRKEVAGTCLGGEA